MHAIKVSLDDKLLRATNRAAREIRKSRSALIRDALSEHLKRLHLLELERRDRRGYESHPRQDDLAAWERVASSRGTEAA